MNFIMDFVRGTGINEFLNDPVLLGKTLAMYVIIGVLVYLAIGKKFEPLLLLPIAFGMLLANLPGAELFHMEYFTDPSGNLNYGQILKGGLIDILYLGVKLGIYPSLIFLGVGAMTDFTPLIANPKSLLIGAGAQLGVFVAFAGALISGQFSLAEAASIGIIGGADGPTAIYFCRPSCCLDRADGRTDDATGGSPRQDGKDECQSARNRHMACQQTGERGHT